MMDLNGSLDRGLCSRYIGVQLRVILQASTICSDCFTSFFRVVFLYLRWIFAFIRFSPFFFFFLKPTLPALPFGAFAFNIMMFVHMIVLLVLLEMQRRSK